MDSGMDTAMINVERQEPRKIRIIVAVRQAAMTASLTTPWTALVTNTDWSKISLTSNPGARPARTCGSRALTRWTMSSVEAPPLLRTDNRAERTPFWRTMLLWTA